MSGMRMSWSSGPISAPVRTVAGATPSSQRVGGFPHIWRVPQRGLSQTQRMQAAAVLLLSFAAGAIPFSYLAGRRARGVDLRRGGTGTVSGTSLYRVAGLGPLAAAGGLEVAKGAVGPAVAPAAGRPALAAVAGGAAVVGHNWSPFLRGAGGRGISPALGALLVVAWPGAVLLLAGMILGKVFGETAVGALV